MFDSHNVRDISVPNLSDHNVGTPDFTLPHHGDTINTSLTKRQRLKQPSLTKRVPTDALWSNGAIVVPANTALFADHTRKIGTYRLNGGSAIVVLDTHNRANKIVAHVKPNNAGTVVSKIHDLITQHGMLAPIVYVVGPGRPVRGSATWITKWAADVAIQHLVAELGHQTVGVQYHLLPNTNPGAARMGAVLVDERGRVFVDRSWHPVP
ncbi:hypothetical protein MMC18_006007 [Xylographa bjoerkii]|nr:hypothetical protein [Xylographa bjoerkii]